MKQLFAGLVASLFSLPVLAGDAFIRVFIDEAPLSGAEVIIDEVPLGKTNVRGGASGPIGSGTHLLILKDDETEFPIEFSSTIDEDVEITVTFTSQAGDTPEVSIRKFSPEDGDAQGFLTGQVLDSAGTPVNGATVSVVDTPYTTTTDAEGIFTLEIPRGEYDIAVAAEGYSAAQMPGVRIMADLGVTATVRLTPFAAGDATAATPPSLPTIEEVFVLGVFNPTEDSASVERYATSITNAIDVEQLERFGDSDVASALNRVVGVAVTDSRYATVRGLDGRYISSTLNGLLMPSTDPQRRDVQLDLFPTDILGGIEIQKSYTPDQLATTTGGSIKIITKGIPDEQIRKLGGSIAYNTEFTGDDIIKYRGSDTDWIGYDSGLRDLPSGVLAATEQGRSLTICDPELDPICTSPLDAARLGVKFQDDYNIKEKTAAPDASLSAVLGDRLPAGPNEWGYYLAATYDYSTASRTDADLTNPLETTGGYERVEETAKVTGYAALAYEYGDANVVESKTTFLRASDDTTRLESGLDGLEENQLDIYLLQWVERQFFSQAITGSNEFVFDEGAHVLDWRMAYSRTERDEPDRRQYTYFNGNLSTSAFERRWSDLEEDAYDIGADYTIPLEWGNSNFTEFKVGALYSNKDRSVDQYRFGVRLGSNADDLDLGIDQNLEEILSYQNYALDKVRLAANTTDTDSYDSEEEIIAYYLTTNTEFGDSFDLLLGARYEDFDQTLDYPNDPSSSNELPYDDWYPALNVTYRPTEELQFRAGYSETVSYPGLIERSEAQSFDPDTDDPIFGNPDLDVSTIDNYDLRAEYYFEDGQTVSLALFYKDITQPIERAVPDASGSAARGITFLNQDSAELFGVELDGSMNLFDEPEYLLFIAGNVTYIDSEVQLSEESLRLEGENANGRQLQGQSEWLGNLQLGWDHYETEQKATLLLNYFDDRIFRVSRGANTGPEFEDARLVIDITYEKRFGEKVTFEASVKNLLNEPVEFSQNGRTIESYKTGTLLGVSLSYQF
ncbi:MAG: TonB-dependent receptor [Pseudomonadota bacterium]